MSGKQSNNTPGRIYFQYQQEVNFFLQKKIETTQRQMIARIEKLLVKISKSNNEHQLLTDVDTMKLNPSRYEWKRFSS